jgi:peptidoglycan/LPS O-acetylase OafA/YrhL
LTFETFAGDRSRRACVHSVRDARPRVTIEVSNERRRSVNGAFRLKYRAEIDGLRALAVVPVILFHAGFASFSGGFVGVDVFFVISGYLITTILIEDLEKKEFSLAKFYERRARRILPALFLIMALCIPFAWFWMLPGQYKDFSQSLLATSLFVSNIWFWKESGYFAPAVEEQPLLHTWSLAVEEQYYLVFPIFLLLIWRARQKSLFWIIAIVLACSLLLSEWASRNYASANFYLAPTRLWELLAGSLSALVVQKRGVVPNNTLATFGLIAILIALFCFDSDTPFPSFYAVLPVGGVVLIILFADGETHVSKLLSLRLLVGIGLISYSAYLWHQPLFAFARVYSIGTPSMLTIQSLAALSIGLAYLTWRFVEAPFRNHQHFTRRAIFLFSVASLASTFALGFAFHFGLQPDTSDSKYGQFIQTEGTTGANYGLPDSMCSSQRGIRVCQTSDEARIFLWGDSFAMHIAQLFEQNPIGLKQATMSSCFPVAAVTPYPQSAKYGEAWAKRCHEFARTSMNIALEDTYVEYVVLSSTFSWPLNVDSYYDGVDTRRSSPSIYIDALREGATKLRAAGKKVVIVGPTPTASDGFDFVKCAKKLLIRTPADRPTNSSGCNFHSPPSHVDVYLDQIEETTNIPVVRLKDYICDLSYECSPFVDGELIYRDWGHLTPHGATMLQRKWDIGGTAVKQAK